MMTCDIDFYVEESGQREFKVGEEWPFQYPTSRLGSAISGIAAKVIRAADGADVTAQWWPSGSGAVVGGYVQLTAVKMLAKGDYELTLITNTDGVVGRRDVFAFRVYE